MRLPAARDLIALALLTLAGLGQGGEAGGESPAAPQAPTTAVEPATTPAALLAALPQAASLVERDAALYWDDGKGSAYRVVAVDAGGAVLDTEIGRLGVIRKLIADNRTDALAVLPKLVARAQAAGITTAAGAPQAAPGLVLAEGIMTGLHLRSAETLVLVEGVLRKSAAPAVDRKADVEKIAALAKRAQAAVEGAGFDLLGRKTVADMLGRLPLADDARKFDYDEVVPAFARRVVRHGWLDGVLKDQELAKALAAAVADAETLVPVTLFEGEKLRLAEVKNAFGNGGWMLSTPTRSVYTRPHATPMYCNVAADQALNLVVDLAAGTDPMSGHYTDQQLLGASIFAGSQAIATWRAGQPLAADPAIWRKAMPEMGPRLDDNIVANYLPPHLVVTEMDGDVRRLVTVHGEVPAPATGDLASEAFLNAAAKALPDAPHLDLVGEYLFYYVYDSPDSRFPNLIGNKAVKGDIHQTVQQTLGTACGGMCRGDCDDLSEFYQEVAERQGRTAHIITLPAHAALAWAEKRDDGWHTFILQTGQPLEFTAPDLPGSLKLAYSSFDESDTFDANGLGLLLRFSGENTRSSWRLSWRIFAEPEYAKTMIDVQKDWHFQTYQRGIAKMLKLIADGDDDTANYRELSGLYSFTGQYDKSVEYHEKALERTTDPESRLYATLELVQHLFEARQEAKARSVALDVLDRQFPAMQEAIGPRKVQLGLQLSATLAKGKAFDLARRALKETLLDDVVGQIDQVGQWLASNQFTQRRWDAASQLRRMQQMYVGIALELLAGAGPEALPGDDTNRAVVKSVQDWLTLVAFHDVDEKEEVLLRYAAAGHYYAAVLGRDPLLAMLADAKLPAKADYDHTKRIGGLAQVAIDLPWIKLSVPFWNNQLEKLFEREAKTLDRELVARLGKELKEAYAACAALDLDHPILEHEYHIGTLITALVAQDEKTLRARLKFIADKNDKRLRDDTAQWLGDTARFMPKEWFATVMRCWQEEVHYKPKYFWIAWRAALNGGTEQALAVGELAAKEFADDPAFTEEYQFMKQVFAAPRKELPRTPATVPVQPKPETDPVGTP